MEDHHPQNSEDDHHGHADADHQLGPLHGGGDGGWDLYVCDTLW